MARHGGGFGLRLSPFRALRFTAGPDLSDLLCPPYDVVEPDRRARLLQRHEHNMVHLTLPEAGDAAAAAATLQRWVFGGVLALDPTACLYVLEQTGVGRRWRGILGAAWLDGADDGSVLPHEDVLPGPVQDRLRLLRATRTDLEPILLTVDGGLGSVVERLAAGPPVATATSGEVGLRLWAVEDPAAHAAVSQALAGRPALIADGHHRWTAAREHARTRGPASGSGADRCLALVVDGRTDPLAVGAIHRVLAGHSASGLRGLWADAAEWTASSPRAPVVATHVANLGQGALGLLDEGRAWIGRRRGTARVVRDGHSAQWAGLSAAWLHEALLPAAGVAEDDVSYHHSAEDAARAAAAAPGTAVLLPPVGLATVRALAAAGERMPRKSTSFSPKPPSGLVLRPHGGG